ncbi:branched-chain amino acid ABC transporter permease [Falsiruegeria mediterranea]|uniref:High-affinity branched-chain amino acid transport system permease protein LivH n=1 Tax=Falsiruegeria mediterranea M17 TaxID=1200281 RepID=A0A2R8C962_9RHOB|nr:branched-chain amino acid ABC transporter permease [Falsiruegeria mediterranea]SPJ28977.1 High-affinity branched-chain amino acid transport system permease protein LivH [Falsiruegeria mediterranea M17]
MDLGLVVYAMNLAAIYALMAVGISILWSSVGVINMAHGATFAVSGYAAWIFTGAMKPVIAGAFGTSAMATLALAGALVASALIAGALCGLVIYLLAFLPIHDKPNFQVRALIITLGLNIATVQTLLWYFGPRNQGLPKIFGFGRWEVLGTRIRYDQAGTIIGATLIMALTLAWLRYSRKGLEVRAMMQNAEGAAYSGISRQATALPVLMLTGALAGMAAALLSQTIFVSPTSGTIPLVKGLTIALLGGLGSVSGALIAALLVGFLEAIIGAVPFLGQRYVLFGTFIFIIAVLVIRPRGIGGLLDDTRE